MQTRPVPGELAAGLEWRTLSLIALCYLGWIVAVFWLAAVAPVLAVLAMAWIAALHSSLTHEALHGHPFRSRALNEALMVLPLTLFIPYGRFRDLHLAHHRDSRLTDPYDDPESNYLDPAVWAGLPGWRRALLRANNTLLGRMLLGPVIGQVCFMAADWRVWRAGERGVARAWGLHLLGAAAVLAVVAGSAMPIWAFVLAAYLGLALLKIRTFLEHRAHEKARARTVIIEDRGPLAFLFLNNNLHAVHHRNPCAPWYRLPGLYAQERAHYLEDNEAYVYRSYGEVFRRHFLRAKDPVPHPLWPPR